MAEALETQVDRLLVLTAEMEPDREAFAACRMALVEAAEDASPEARDTALRRMAVALDHADSRIGGSVAITGGALVEGGASPDIWFSALLPRLIETLQATLPFVEACEAALPPEDEDEAAEEEYEDDEEFDEEAEYDEEFEDESDEFEEEDEDEGGLWLGDRMVPAEAVEKIIAAHRNGYLAYEALETWCLPMIACLSRSADLRAQAQQRPELLQLATRFAPYNGQSEFLRKMLLVLDDETLLVIHPETRKGFRCRIGGIADNFQLHILLSDALITPARSGGVIGRLFGRKEEAPAEGLTGTRPHPVIIAVAKGEAAQTASIQSSGIWNLYQWTAWDGTGQLPGFESSEDWVWNEGVPADIPPFEGVRVLLLGPPSYQRNWSTVRLFDRMKAFATVEERLSPQDVETWLKRFASAPRP